MSFSMDSSIFHNETVKSPEDLPLDSSTLEAIVWNLCDASLRRLGSPRLDIHLEAKMKKVGHANPGLILFDILYIYYNIIAYNMTIEAYWTCFLRIGLRMKGYRYRQISTGSQPNRCHKQRGISETKYGHPQRRTMDTGKRLVVGRSLALQLR